MAADTSLCAVTTTLLDTGTAASSSSPVAKTAETSRSPTAGLRGCHVCTPYGWGICIRDVPDATHVQVALDWRLRDGRRASCSVRRGDISARSFCAIGECVLTSFGTGVLLGFQPKDRVHRVQLWSKCGSSRSFAYLREEALLSVIPAAVGLSVETPFGIGTCKGYQSGTHGGIAQFFVDLPWGARAVLRPDSVSCPVAMTLPLIDRFLGMAADLLKLHMDTLNRLRQALSGLGLECLQDKLTTCASEAAQAATDILNEWESKDAKTMVDRMKLKADEVLDDPRMTQALNNGISRLTVLYCNNKGFDGTWIGKSDSLPRCTIHEAVITWHWGEQTELEIWSQDRISTMLAEEGIFEGKQLPDGSLEWTDGDAWMLSAPPPREDGSTDVEATQEASLDLDVVKRSLGDLRRILGGGADLEGEVEEALGALSRLASSDVEVQRIVEEIQSRRSSLLKIRAQLMESKTGKVLQQGHSRLARHFADLQSTATPQLQQVQQRSKRFLTRLSTDRSLKSKASELYSGAQAMITSKWNDASDPRRAGLETWVADVKERIISRLGSHRALLAQSLSALQLQQVDVRQLIANSWDPAALEAQLERMLVRATKFSGLENTSGAELLDRFEGASAMAQIPALQRTYQGIVATLNDFGLDVPVPIRKLLEAQAAGHHSDVEAWRTAIVGSLDDDSVVKGAEELVQQGEKLIRKCQDLKANKTLARVMEHLESDDVERDLLRRVHDLDPQALLNGAEGALTDAEVRERLVNKLLDTALDFILKILPAIHIDKVSGTDNGCDWEISNISFSDFSFRKENVHMTLGSPANASQELLRISAEGISAHFRDLKVSVKQTSMPYLTAEGAAVAKAEGMRLMLAFRLCQAADPAESSQSPERKTSGGRVTLYNPPVRDQQSSGGDGASQGSPVAGSETSAAAAAAACAAALRPTVPTDPHANAAPKQALAGPRVEMSSRSVVMDNLDLWISESYASVMINTLSYLFADVLKEYACQKIMEHLDEHLGPMIAGLNAVLAACAPHLARLGFDILVVPQELDIGPTPVAPFKLRGVPQVNPGRDFLCPEVDIVRLNEGNALSAALGRPAAGSALGRPAAVPAATMADSDSEDDLAGWDR